MSKYVTSPNNDPGGIERGKLNTALINNPQFKSACEKAGVPVTRRQASKYRNKKGIAYKSGR